MRQLSQTDLPGFQAVQGNAQVMQYTTGISLPPEESARELEKIITLYTLPGNETWIWAVAAKAGTKVVIKQNDFVGTCALFKNEAQEFEIAYRLRRTGSGQSLALTMELSS